MNALAFLRNHHFFQEFREKDLDRLAGLVEVETYPPEDKVIRSGDEGNCAYLVMQGRIRIEIKGGEVVRYAGAGEMLGEMALLTGETRTADCITETETSVLKITSELFERIVGEYQTLGEAVSELLIDRLLTLDESRRRVDQYQVVDKLGMGGMGVVFRGLHLKLNRPVAIKFLYHHLALNEEYRENFNRESQIFSLMDHPNIVRVHDAGEAFRTLYLVMDLIEGTTLNNLVRGGERIDPDRVRRILLPLLDALAYAGQRNVIHRDIKPQNIILDLSGNPLLMDFGLAMKEGMKQEEELYGTVEYVSPEQIEGGAIDGRSDLYSLGITAFELLTGFVPFRDDDPYAVISMHMRESVPSVRRFVPDCPLDLAQFVHKATRRDPGERFQSASEARESLHGTETEPGRRKRRMAVEYNAKLDSQVEPIWRKMRQRLEGIPGLQFVEDRASATTED